METAGQILKSLRRLREFRARHPDVPVTSPAGGPSGLWSAGFPDGREYFSDIGRLVIALDAWETK